MQVKIEHSCFISKGNHQDLDTIFSLFVEEQHKWIDIDFEEIEKTEWFKNLGDRNINDLKTLFVSSTRKSNSKKTISVYNETNDEFNVFEAKLYLKQPLTIIVENYEYEPDFINCIFKNFGIELLEAKNKHFLKFENGGGKNDNAIKGMLKELFNDPVFTKNKETYLRCYSIKDSDRKYCINSDELPESTNTYLKDNNIPLHILYKRAKENYMPNVILSKLNDNYFDTILKVFEDDLKRDFFNYTNGFDNKNKSDKDWNTKRSQEYEFFDIKNIDDNDFKKLKNGIDNKEVFKKSFSINFINVNKNDLENRIQHQPKLKSKVNPNDMTERNEFEHIIHEIKYLL